MTASIATAPGVTPTLQIGVGSLYDPKGTALWQVARWGDPTATWNASEPTWLDVVCEGMSVETSSGRERSADTWDIGVATATVRNETGWADYPLDPMSLPDPDLAPLLTVKPGREVRIGVTLNADPLTPYWLFRGVLDEVAPLYTAGETSLTELSCIDAKGDAGRADVAKVIDPGVGASETANVRINRILDAVRYPTWRRAVEPDGTQLIATTLGERAVDLLNRAADSCGGAVMGDLDGKLAFKPRDWQTSLGTAVVVGTIGNMSQEPIGQGELVEDPPGSGLVDFGALAMVEDPPGSGLYEDQEPTLDFYEDPSGTSLYTNRADNLIVCPSVWEMSFARADFTTRVIYGRTTDDVPKELDATDESFAQLGMETYSATDLDTLLDSDLDAIAERILSTRSWLYAPRVAAVHVDAGSSPDAAKFLATISPLVPSRVRCQHQENGRVVFNRLMLVTGIRHTLTPDSWTARIALDDAAPYEGGTGGGRWQTTGHWAQTNWTHPV